MTEDYVSFETAKLLKEKGFDWLESPFYSEQDRDEWRRNAWYSIPNPRYDETIPFDSPTLYVTAPHISIQMAMKWLRERKQIFIHIQRCKFKFFFTTERMNESSENEYSLGHFKEFERNTYEETCEAAIKFCLENLIQI